MAPKSRATEVVSASAWEAWSRAAPGGMVARGRADRNQARRDRGRSPGSREEAGEALERLAPAHLHRRHRLAEGSEFCVRGIERRVSSVPRPIPACRSRVTVMAIRAGHGPPNGEGATLRLASANEMTRPSRLGASTSVNCQSAQVSGTLGPRKPQKNVPPTRRSRSAVTGGRGHAQDNRQVRSTADADGRGAYWRGSPVFRGFAAHDRADPQGAGG